MLKKNKIIYILFLAAVLIIPFSLAIAQAPIVPCGIGSDPKNACTLCHLIVGIHRLVTYGRNILITVAAVGIFISGVMYVVSSGNENAITRAKGFLSASLVGFSVVLAAWFIVNVVMWVLSFNTDIIGKENWYTFTCSTQSSSASQNDTTSTPAPAPPIPTYPCHCADGSLIPFYYPLNGASVNLATGDECHQECANRGAKYYSFSNIAGVASVFNMVTKAPNQ